MYPLNYRIREFQCPLDHITTINNSTGVLLKMLHGHSEQMIIITVILLFIVMTIHSLL